MLPIMLLKFRTMELGEFSGKVRLAFQAKAFFFGNCEIGFEKGSVINYRYWDNESH